MKPPLQSVGNGWKIRSKNSGNSTKPGLKPHRNSDIRSLLTHGGESGPDLEEVARLNNLTPAEVIKLHSSQIYEVYFVGFAPGFAYLGPLPVGLDAPRLSRPRAKVAAGSVAMAAGMTCVYPLLSPGGWRIIGRTDTKVLYLPNSRHFFSHPVTKFNSIQWIEAKVEDKNYCFGWRIVNHATRFGKVGELAFWSPPGGALDRAAHIAANHLVQNEPNAATLEIILKGPTLRFETQALIAVTGAINNITELSDGRTVPLGIATFVRAGQELTFKSLAQGSKLGRCSYLAVHGGFVAPLVMSSRSTYLRANIGGHLGEGRKLTTNDVLESYDWQLRCPVEGAGRIWPFTKQPDYRSEVSLCIIPGPYLENFAPDALPALLSNTYTVTADSDRMGFRLEGKKLEHFTPQQAEIDSCPTVFGAIQVPSNGQPIVLMADHQVTGGYPIIACVVSNDLPLLAQLLPGGTVQIHNLKLF